MYSGFKEITVFSKLSGFARPEKRRTLFPATQNNGFAFPFISHNEVTPCLATETDFLNFTFKNLFNVSKSLSDIKSDFVIINSLALSPPLGNNAPQPKGFVASINTISLFLFSFLC